MQLKEKMIYILRVNTTLIVLVHPYNEKTEGGILLQEHAKPCHTYAIPMQQVYYKYEY